MSRSPNALRPDLSDNDRVVLTTLGRAKRPLSAYDILNNARSDSIKAPTQVYRSLQKLELRGLVHRIEALSAFVACSDAHMRDHDPGFVICRGCGSVREFDSADIRAVAVKAAGAQFSVEAIALEVYGRCGSCAEEMRQ